MGYPHREGQAYLGSVFTEPLADGEESLWLEHVTCKADPSDQCYWLMWYGPNGTPRIPLSGVLHRDDIANMSRLLASFVP
jgi:hypothetical protein